MDWMNVHIILWMLNGLSEATISKIEISIQFRHIYYKHCLQNQEIFTSFTCERVFDYDSRCSTECSGPRVANEKKSHGADYVNN